MERANIGIFCMSKKTFKIGEYCKGGIIKAETLSDSRLKITCHDWDSQEQLFGLTSDDYHDLRDELEDWTSSYWADVVLDWWKSQTREVKATDFMRSMGINVVEL